MTHRKKSSKRLTDHNERGIQLAERGWLEEAAKEFNKAIEQEPNSAFSHNNLGIVLAEKGELLQALTEFVAAVRAEPESPAAQHLLGSFLAGYAQELAVQQFKKAIELDPEYADAYLSLGSVLSDEGELEAAAEAVNIASQLEPDDEVIAHELACCYIDLERYNDAIPILKELCKNFPNRVEAYIDLGIAYTAQGFIQAAEQAFQDAIRIDPHDASSYYHYAILLHHENRLSEAQQQLEHALEQNPNEVHTWLEREEDESFIQLLNNNHHHDI